jgi:hypothetical protein
MRDFKFLLAAALVLAPWTAAASAQSHDTYNPAEPTSGGAALSPNPWSPSEGVLYDNGPFETSPGESLLENITLGLTTLGAAAQGASGNAVADDFDVTGGDGWFVDQITGFTYQSFAPNSTTVTEVNVRIYDGDPSIGGATVVFDGSAGCLSNTTETNVFRRAENTPGATDRAIFTATCSVGMDFPPGTYWAEFGFVGSLAFSGPWAPPVTILGTTPVAGANGLQFFGGAWQQLQDGGNFDPLAVPFIIDGDDTIILCRACFPTDIPTLGQWGLITLALLLMTAGAYTLNRRRRSDAQNA